MAKIHACLLTILIGSILLQVGCLTITSIVSKEIQRLKNFQEIIKESSAMSQKKKDFAKEIINQLNGQEQLLLTGFYISATVLILMTFRGIILSMILFSKGASRTEKTSNIFRRPYEELQFLYTEEEIKKDGSDGEIA